MSRVGLLLTFSFQLSAFSFPLLAEEPLYQREPYDQITLDKANDNAVLKVQPLDLPGRRVPEKPSPNDTLTVRLLDKPDQPYSIKWKSIVRDKVKLFEQMVLEEANRLVSQRQLDEAFDYFRFLEENYPKVDGLENAIENYLYEEAKALHLDGRYEAALAVLRELHERNPKRPELKNALGLTTEKLVQQHVAADNYTAARLLLHNLAALYPDHPVVAKWETSFQDEAGRLLEEARQNVQNDQLRKANEIGRRLMLIWPQLPGLKEFLKSLHERYARVVVAVTVPASVANAAEIDNWAWRRNRRLLYRTIMEFAGPGIEGGNYICPLGKMEIQELGLRLAFQLKPDLKWSTGDAALTGYDLSQRLLAMADPSQPVYRVEWAELLAGVSVKDVYSVDVDLSRPHVRPEALLQTTVVPYAGRPDARSPEATNGPYVLDSQADGECTFATNSRYFAPGPTQPKEIVERPFDQAAKAIWELDHRRVDLIDRVNPWDVDKVRQIKDLVVQPYGMPLVHCLVPNVRKPLLARTEFRRALVYGINRDAILGRLLGGKTRQGCRVLSGPFSPGISREDPLGYAYDESIEPRTYEPRLAVALAQVAFQGLAAAMKKQGEKLAAMPELVLAHPPDEIARMASTEIQRQLGVVGIRVTLEELPPDAGSRVPDDADLLYAELAVWEPVVDARRLLDHDGISGGASPYMTQALRQLELAPDWLQVGAKLRQIHRLAHQEVSVIPLWQLTDYFAYHRSLEGVGSGPVTLYQNVEHWKPAFYFAAEGE